MWSATRAWASRWTLGGGLRRGRFDQAEHPPARLADPVPQVAHAVGGLRLQVGEMSPGDVFHRYPAVDLVDIHEKRHWPPPSDRRDRHNDRRQARSAG